MSNCFDMPFFGVTCLGDLTVRFGSYSLDMTHPGVGATITIAAVLGVFVFRSPA